MPRKVSYGLDLDDDYYYDDDYDDYDYDDVDADGHGGPDTKQETIKPGLWQCSICTYDNDESMAFCDICGVVRRPSHNIGTSDSSKIAEDIHKIPGASKLARSLFQSLPQQIPKEVILFPKLGDGFLTDGSIFYKLENVRGEFHEIHKDFSTQSHPHLNIGVNQF